MITDWIVTDILTDRHFYTVENIKFLRREEKLMIFLMVGGGVYKTIKLITSFCIINNFIRIFLARLLVGVYSLPRMVNIFKPCRIATYSNSKKCPFIFMI